MTLPTDSEDTISRVERESGTSRNDWTVADWRIVAERAAKREAALNVALAMSIAKTDEAIRLANELVKHERPGLSRVQTSADRVKRAQSQLQDLLTDPFYKEAYFRLLKHGKLPNSPSGIFPNTLGDYADKLSRTADNPNKRKGAPRKSSSETYRRLAEVIYRKGIPVQKAVVALLSEKYPDLTKETISAAPVTKKIAQAIRDAHRKK